MASRAMGGVDAATAVGAARETLVGMHSARGAHGVLARSLIGPARTSSKLWKGTGNSARIRRLFGLAIENTRLATAARDLATAAREGRRVRCVFVNAHALTTAMGDTNYKATVASADRIFADGSGMAVAALMCGTPLIDNVNGTDLFPLLCQEAIAAGSSIFLVGGKPGVAAEAAGTIAAFNMGAAIAGTHHGYFKPGSAEEDAVIEQINASGAGIVLVGMGVPIQDQWAQRICGRLNAPVIAGVGGLFDFFSGRVSRSPKFMRTVGCEWVWRLALEPRRMAYRYIIGNLVFLSYAVVEAVHQRGGRKPLGDLAGAPTSRRQPSIISSE